jgi:O-antigen ligase/Flp pilus assembly protein TadD
MYSLPKFGLLLTGTAALLPLLAWRSIIAPTSRRLLSSRQVLLVSLFSIVLTISTILGASPVASLFGSSYNQMGLITHLCLFILFIGLIVVNGKSEKRFRTTLWVITVTGLAVATYAFMQFFGRDPFLQSGSYTFKTSAGPILRVNSTLGHSNYLGNFLLYVTPLSAGLALSSHGQARRLGLMIAVLSTTAIALTGTRGAWVGLVVAAFAFVLLIKSRGSSRSLDRDKRRTTILWAGGAFVIIGTLFTMVGLNPASRGIVQRALSLVKEHSGSGRTVLWRDSLRMVPDYALFGCGPEGFRTAFLPYKSMDLARLAPETNNESSHNSYIDAAVSYGLPGAVLYVAIIASSFSLLLSVYRRATSDGTKIISLSLVSSLAGVVVHNFFIFDQISTGLYFFAFAALAQISRNIQTNDSPDPGGAAVGGKRDHRIRAQYRTADEGRDAMSRASKIVRRSAPFMLAASLVLAFAAGWYSIAIARADIQINRAIAAAAAGDLGRVVEHGNRAISSPDPTGDYSYLFAQALVYWVDRSGAISGSSGRVQSESSAGQQRKLALSLAMCHAEESLAHTLTPDATYVLLSYLALRLGDKEKLLAYASEAIKRDAKFSNSHWLMAEAYFAAGESEAAEREANFALSLNTNSSEARSVLRRLRGAPETAGNREEMLRYGRNLAKAGNFKKARSVFLRALQSSVAPCPDCHSALGSLYESAELYNEAIAEWQAFAREAPDRALAESTNSRIKRLTKAAGTHQ